MTSGSAWRQLPARAADLFGITLGAAELEKLEMFLDMLEAWSTRMNLVGKTTRDDLIDRHLLDSLAPGALLASVRRAADLGSGAGFPGVPLATIFPAIDFRLVESRRKRCSFLRHVVRTLHLENVEVIESRAEEWRPAAGSMDVVIGRAIAAPELAGLAVGVLATGGRLIVMRKQGPVGDVDGFRQVAVRRYRLPTGDRHEVAAYERVSA